MIRRTHANAKTFSVSLCDFVWDLCFDSFVQFAMFSLEKYIQHTAGDRTIQMATEFIATEKIFARNIRSSLPFKNKYCDEMVTKKYHICAHH